MRPACCAPDKTEDSRPVFQSQYSTHIRNFHAALMASVFPRNRIANGGKRFIRGFAGYRRFGKPLQLPMYILHSSDHWTWYRNRSAGFTGPPDVYAHAEDGFSTHMSHISLACSVKIRANTADTNTSTISGAAAPTATATVSRTG